MTATTSLSIVVIDEKKYPAIKTMLERDPEIKKFAVVVGIRFPLAIWNQANEYASIIFTHPHKTQKGMTAKPFPKLKRKLILKNCFVFDEASIEITARDNTNTIIFKKFKSSILQKLRPVEEYIPRVATG